MKHILKNETTVAISLMSIFLIIVSLSSIYTYANIYHGDACTCTIPIYVLTSLLPSVGLIIGAIVAYLLGMKLKKVRSKRKSITNSVFKLFTKEEREILKEIVENKGITQAGLGKNTNLNRVKIHRITSDLESKRIIKKIEKGKTYIIELTEDFEFLKGLINKK